MNTRYIIPWNRQRTTSASGRGEAVRSTFAALRRALLPALLLFILTPAQAQQLPLEIRQTDALFNFQSQRGVPISHLTNNPAGSDGRAPNPGSGSVGTVGQFQKMSGFSGGVKGTNAPRGGTGLNAMVLTRARLGNSIVSRSYTHLFGDIIAAPTKDEYGVDLDRTNNAVAPPRLPALASDYWQHEPFTTTDHTNGGYYWSIHAERVYATQPGQVTVVWRKSSPGAPTGSPVDVGTIVSGGTTYTVYTNRYLVATLLTQAPRRMYWTEGPFTQIGKPVSIPTERVREVKVVYNNRFPERSSEYRFGGQLSGPIEITNTLWFDRTVHTIRAYNVEGRIFVELLGDKRGTLGGRDVHQQLGYELVDVIQRPVPGDVTIDLGERLTPFQGESPEGTPELFPDPVLTVGQSFAYRHSVLGTERFDYYAIRETRNQNDFQMHWMEEGLQGLLWPYRYTRYELIWPVDVSRYSHYVRPVVASEAEARATAVPLPAPNAPQIAYQDPLDQPRGKLTDSFAYYSFLNTDYPAHRALLQFNSGGYVRFERVFSWLDTSLRHRNLTLDRFSSGFDSDATNGTLVGHAAISDGVLHLTDALPQQSGWFFLNDFTGGRPVENFHATFNVNLNRASVHDGHGFSFSLYDPPSISLPGGPLPAGEDGFTNGLAVSFDTHDDHSNDFAAAITIWRAGVLIAGVRLASSVAIFNDPGLLSVPLDPATGQPMNFTTGMGFAPVGIVLRSDGTMDVAYKGVTVLTNIVTGYTPRTGAFALGARTGGTNYSTHWIDDLTITANFDAASGPAPFANSVAADLNSWVDDRAFHWPETGHRPRVVTAPVFVGQRLTAPDGELGGGLDTNYLAGYIQTSQGDFYHPTAYVDPFAAGFDLANHGAIIPVNALPGRNLFEVWWFRRNGVNVAQGFQHSHWPAVIGRYTIQWPMGGSEIVLAGDDGSGPLPSLEATGRIYYENDRTQPGFNPNEEHALMQGGQAFALRDDLNITNAGASYTSDPFVLLEYTEQDGRLAIRPFKVRREKPEADITFKYRKAAGSILQPPMPLPLLGVAFAPRIPGQPRKGLNEELIGWRVNDSVTTNSPRSGWTLTTDGPHGFLPFWPLALHQSSANPPTLRWFFGNQVTHDTLTGVVSTNRPVAMRALPVGVAQDAMPNRWRFGLDTNAPVPLGPALLAVPSTAQSWDVIVTNVNRASNFVTVEFSSPRPGAGTTNAVGAVLVPSISSRNSGAFNQWTLSWNEPPLGGDAARQQLYSSSTLTDRKGNVWVYRGPHRADRPESFTMRFYYNTLGGFFFPELALNAQPPVGTPTPYLRPVHPATGQYVGDAVHANVDQDQRADGNALPITYHPVWPENAPVLQMAETLTTPKRGLPAVRGQSSVQVLYQQSQVSLDDSNRMTIHATNTSVLLHDPTREKSIEFPQANLPGSVRTESQLGKVFFPGLPPHLVKRFWLDPSRGSSGALVFNGEFVEAGLGDSYLFLNVAGQKDAATLRGLCLVGDAQKAAWDNAINGLATSMDKFVENPAQPGTYMVWPPATSTVGLTDVAEVNDDDVAVDSYALTAIGPSTGFVSLIAGDGEAFTPEGDPVTVHVLRVVPELYRGEVNVVASENSLNEKLTLQQVVDLAGQAENYTFEWRITSPVDGQPPDIHTKQVLPAFTLAPWSHVRFPLATDKALAIAGTPTNRVAQDMTTAVAPVSEIGFTSVAQDGDLLRFTVPATPPHRLAVGNRLVMSSAAGAQVPATVHDVVENGTDVLASVDPNQTLSLAPEEIFRLSEGVLDDVPQSIAFTRFVVPSGRNVTEVWLGLSHATGLGTKVYLNGGPIAASGLGELDTAPNNPASDLATPRLARYFKLPLSELASASVGPDGSRTNQLAVEFFSRAAPGAFLAFQARIEAFESLDQVVVESSPWLPLDPAQFTDGVRAVLGENADVRSLSDNYLTMRYVLTSARGTTNRWSQWTEPQLAEGWIKRVLAGINPFNQRVSDLFNNSVSTDVSLLTQAGQR